MSPVVMLHGWGMTAGVFDEIAGELAQHVEVTAPDLPGYAGSHTSEPYTLENLAARAASNAPPRCCVVGWSLGAQVALAWARMMPQQVGALVLIGATPCFVQRSNWTCAMDAAAFDLFENSVATDAAAALDRFASLQGQGDSDVRRVMRRLRTVLSTSDIPRVEVLQKGLEILRMSDLRAGLGEIDQPVLVMQGELDRLVPIRAGEYLAQALSGGRLAIVRGAAHAPFISQPRSVGRTIVEFLNVH